MGKKIPLWQCLLVLTALAVFIFWGMTIDTKAHEAHIALLLGGAVAAIVAAFNGWRWSFMEKGILASINRTMEACLILLAVGAMLASWMAGGIVPTIIYYGIKIVTPGVFLFTACLMCSIVSLATGSSWFTAGTMGVIIVGVGIALGFPIYMTAGAVVSGAYFGDKMSPLSDTTNLAPAIAGATLLEHVRHMIWTTGPALVIALAAYLLMGLLEGSSFDSGAKEEVLAFITANYQISIACLIPPAFVVLSAALKFPILPALFCGVLLGLPFFGMQGYSVLGGKEDVVGAAYILNHGVDVEAPRSASNAVSQLAELLTVNGMQSVLWAVSLILCAMVFGGIIDCTGMMRSLSEALLRLAHGTRGGLVSVTIFSCIVVNALCSDQYTAIIVPGRMYKRAFEDLRLAPKNLSRCLEDAGTLTSNFVPWNTCGATMSQFLMCPQWGPVGYAPFAILNWLNPLISIFYGFTGISMTKMTEAEYQQMLLDREKEDEEEENYMRA